MIVVLTKSVPDEQWQEHHRVHSLDELPDTLHSVCAMLDASGGHISGIGVVMHNDVDRTYYVRLHAILDQGIAGV